MKVSPIEVLDYLRRVGKATRQEIALALDCSMGTISKKVATLVRAGENIGFNQDGLFLFEKGDIRDLGDAQTEYKWCLRVVDTLAQWARRGNSTRPIMIEARRIFGTELDRAELKRLKSNLLFITRVVDAADLEEELTE